MNWKRMSGILIIIVGFILYGICARLPEKPMEAPQAEETTPPLRGAYKQDRDHRTTDPDAERKMLCNIASGVLVFGGLLLAIFGDQRKRKKKKRG